MNPERFRCWARRLGFSEHTLQHQRCEQIRRDEMFVTRSAVDHIMNQAQLPRLLQRPPWEM